MARLLLFIGGFAAVVAWWAFAAQQTVFDVQATREAASGLLSAKSLQSKAIDSLSQQVTSILPPGADAAKVQAATTSAMSDPRVREAFGAAVASIQEQLLNNGGTAHQLVVDTSAVTAAVDDALAKVDPTLAKQFNHKPVTFSFDTKGLPNLSGPKRAVPNVALFGALIALGAWLGAILLHPDPWVAVRRIGRRITGIGAAPVVMWIIVPAILVKFKVDAAQTLTPLARTYGKRLAPAAIVLLVVGIALWIGGRVGATAAKAARAAANAANAANAPRRPEAAGLTNYRTDGVSRRGSSTRAPSRGPVTVRADRFETRL